MGRSSCHSINVPYVCGDVDGSFTSVVIKQLALNGLAYSSDCPDYILQISLTHNQKAIGYRYEENFSETIGKRLVASEERLILCATYTLLDRSGHKVLGPCNVSEFLNYDFQPETSPQNQTRFSLGQLDFLRPATDAAKAPLQRLLAKKIADHIWNSL